MDLCRAACPAPAPDPHSPYRRVLWLVLGLNATMFVVEGVAGLIAGSLSLQADALDFLGDAAPTPSPSSCWSARSTGAPRRRSSRAAP